LHFFALVFHKRSSLQPGCAAARSDIGGEDLARLSIAVVHFVVSLENSSGPGKLTENGPVLTTG
jgi:hypothetical protein